MFTKIGEEVDVLAQPPEPVNYETILTEQDCCQAPAQIVEMSFKVRTVVIDCSLRGLCQAIEGRCLGGTCVLADNPIEDVDRLV